MQTLVNLFCQVSEPKEMEAVLTAILTDKECEAIKNRLQIVQMLRDRHTQREVSAKLGVGIATVTRGAHALKEGKFDVLRAYLKAPK